jgi:hypothetical protein
MVAPWSAGCRVASDIAYEHGYCVFSLIGMRLIHFVTQDGVLILVMEGSATCAPLILRGHTSPAWGFVGLCMWCGFHTRVLEILSN